MKLRITPAQAERVNALIRSACCNCIKDRCLLLGGGRDSPCMEETKPITIKMSGSRCRRAVAVQLRTSERSPPQFAFRAMSSLTEWVKGLPEMA